jgi:hypothetical protein
MRAEVGDDIELDGHGAGLDRTDGSGLAFGQPVEPSGGEKAESAALSNCGFQRRSEPIAPLAGFCAMPMLDDADVALLQEACRAGVLRIRVAGRTTEAEKAREFERCKSATVLRYLGFLEEMPDDGAFARWRPARGCEKALRAVLPH